MTKNHGGESWQITQYSILSIILNTQYNVLGTPYKYFPRSIISYYIEGHINFPPYLGLRINKENTGHGNMVKIIYILVDQARMTYEL